MTRDKTNHAMMCKHCMKIGFNGSGYPLVKCNRTINDVKYVEGTYDTPTHIVPIDSCFICDKFTWREFHRLRGLL